MSAMLEVRGLSVSYGGLRAVDGVSLEVRPGEIVSIIGMNGAGKTSILNAVSGIVPPDKGDILFEGESIWRLCRRTPLSPAASSRSRKDG